MKVGSSVGVSGTGVDVGSPGGTVSVGSGVFVMVEVGDAVQAGWTGSVACGCGLETILFAINVITVTQTVPMTPITAAMIAGSILLVVVIVLPICGFFQF